MNINSLQMAKPDSWPWHMILGCTYGQINKVIRKERVGPRYVWVSVFHERGQSL